MKENLNINLSLDKTMEVKCDSCDNNVFVPGFLFREASRFLTGTSEDALIPIQIFICSKCGEPLEQTVPIELKKKKKLDE